MNKSHIIIYLLLLVSLSSCLSKKKIVYLQGQQKQSSDQVNYEPLIQNDDMLSISIMSSEPELAAPFNIDQMQNNGITANSNSIKTTYLVDNSGEIDFPVLGKNESCWLHEELFKTIFK